MPSNFFTALFETVVNTGVTAAEQYGQPAPKKGKKAKGPSCTPCAVKARMHAAKVATGGGG